MNLLSFGEEAEEEEKELAAVSTRIRSSHDVLDDPRLLKEGKHDQALVMTMPILHHLYLQKYQALYLIVAMSEKQVKL